jgi:hypothetical protein
MGEMRNAYKILVRISKGRDHFETWVDNIKMHLLEVGCEGVYWIHLDQERDQ